MTTWRCLNAQCATAEFESAEPKCPGCGVDRRNPRYAGHVAAFVAVHFDPPDPVVPRMGLGRLACDPARPVAGSHATGSHLAVSCKACRESEAFRASYRAPLGGPPVADAVVGIDARRGVLTAEPCGCGE
jgi:hypothetical protein